MLSMKHTILDFIKWLYWRYLRTWIVRLSPPAVCSLTAPASCARFILSPARRTIMSAELSSCGLLNGRNKNRVMYETFRNHLATQIKMSYLPRIGKENVDAFLPIYGRANLDKALKKGRGVILLNPHFGPFMLVMPALGYRGYEVNQVALQGEPIVGRRKGLGKLAYNAKFDAIERNMPINFINAAESGMALREVVRALERNEIVLFASTGRGGKAWHEVPFLGRTAKFNLTPFRIAARTSAVVLPVLVMNAGPFAELVIEKPICPQTGNTPETMLAEYASVLGTSVENHPEHFAFFLHDMRMNAWWDDHPFFSDYPAQSEPAETRDRGA